MVLGAKCLGKYELLLSTAIVELFDKFRIVIYMHKCACTRRHARLTRKVQILMRVHLIIFSLGC